MDSPHSLHLVHVKLLAADLLTLTSRHTSPPSFARCGRTVTRAEIVGVVVSRDRREKFLRFLVDDGTGCVPCVLWLNHQYLNANNSSSRGSDSDPTAEMALRMSEVMSLGTVLRVRGRIVLYRGAIQIAVRDVVLEKDPNVEDLVLLVNVHVIMVRIELNMREYGQPHYHLVRIAIEKEKQSNQRYRCSMLIWLMRTEKADILGVQP
uniref:CST complex subunit STN1 n=1 Tax=Leersia perrieri TaxID=77586 RepID=A0A0D9VUC2_9ORYZ